MSFLLASAARATTGARSGQEDAFRLWPTEGVARPEGENGGLLAVLADGMGGHTGGAVAGETACSTFADVFAATAPPHDRRLQSALQASNEALAKGVEKNSALRGMGCTLVAAWMDTFGVRWTSVGDSLLLLYRFPDVIRLNADHSLGSFLDEQARQNRITESEAKQLKDDYLSVEHLSAHRETSLIRLLADIAVALGIGNQGGDIGVLRLAHLQ